MPSSYVETVSRETVQKLFDHLLKQLPSSDQRSILAEIYTSELGDPGLGDYSTAQIRDQLYVQPIHFFAIVSLLLNNPPAFLRDAEQRENFALPLSIQISDFERIRVTGDGVWIRELNLDSASQTPLLINRYEYRRTSSTNEITTTHIYDYLKSAALCFRYGSFPSALALAAIAFESCLRDVLTGINRHLLPKQPAYQRSNARVLAHIDTDDGEPVLSFSIRNTAQDIRDHFRAYPPKGSKQFLSHIDLKICRGDTPNSALRLFVDSAHVNLLSTDRREAFAGHRKANKFKDFIEAAENAGRLHARQLPLNSAEVIRQVRNNLVHWSKDALDIELESGLSIGEYIRRADTVRTTITHVANYISDEYYDLRRFERGETL